MNYKIKIIIFSLLVSSFSFAQDSTKTNNNKEIEKQHKNLHQNFVDADGDGYNDNAPDHDGDGIPNGIDPDYIKLNKRENESIEYIDSNGDGINDNLQFNGKRKRRGIQKSRFNNQLTPQNSNSEKLIENKHKNKKAKGKG